jgi:hypothetical protein
MTVFRYLIIIQFLVFFNESIRGQQDTLPPPVKTPVSLFTLDDYTSSAAYGLSTGEMLNRISKTDMRKNLFNRQGSKFILPSIFIAYGVAARFNQLPVRQWDLDINYEFRKRLEEREYAIDTYFEYGLPVVAYGLAFIPGVNARHNFRDRTLVFSTSFLLMSGTVRVLKTQIPVRRPNTFLLSFPSGHTATAVMSAHFMYKEYKETSPWIGIGGYLMATTTGVFRMVNKKHWFSDVVMGAGIGILSVEIGYMMLPVWHSLFGIKDDGECFVAVPTFSTQSMGLGLVYRF